MVYLELLSFQFLLSLCCPETALLLDTAVNVDDTAVGQLVQQGRMDAEYVSTFDDECAETQANVVVHVLELCFQTCLRNQSSNKQSLQVAKSSASGYNPNEQSLTPVAAILLQRGSV